MRILFCCQFYAPSVGGVQEVVMQVAERLAGRGHQVTVATTRLPNRDFEVLNGVAVKGFDVAGSRVAGITGDVRAYQEFVLSGQFDAVLVYAAQQWTFDALWPILGQISMRKVLVPCGFSGLYEPGYADYFREMPAILRQFDHLVFHASGYRDIDFARAHGLANLSVVPNGASEEICTARPDPSFRERYGIPKDSFVFLTVGSFTGLKGHLELAKAFGRMKLRPGAHATLILNGNEPQAVNAGVRGFVARLTGLIRTRGVRHALALLWKKLVGAGASPRKIAEQINAGQPAKQVLVTDLPREELVHAFMAADLFVFASNIEYSPLVLFESAAAGTPFLTVDVGNALEIAQWTGAGVACPSRRDANGYTRVNDAALAGAMVELMAQPDKLRDLGAAGRRNLLERFTWGKIAIQYERIFQGLPLDLERAK